MMNGSSINPYETHNNILQIQPVSVAELYLHTCLIHSFAKDGGINKKEGTNYKAKLGDDDDDCCCSTVHEYGR